MKYFKQEPRTIKDISNESLHLNKYITINNILIYLTKWEIAGIHTIRDIIINDSNTSLTHSQIVSIYNLKTFFMETLQLQKYLPKSWFDTIKKHTKCF